MLSNLLMRLGVNFNNRADFLGVSVHEQGKYTCYVDERPMLQAKIQVARKRGLLTEGLFDCKI